MVDWGEKGKVEKKRLRCWHTDAYLTIIWDVWDIAGH